MASEAELKTIRYWYETQCPATSVEYVGKLLRAYDEAAALIRRQQQQYAMLDEVCAGQARDAARWRELRDGNGTSSEYPDAMLLLVAVYAGSQRWHEVSDYDAAIDSALPTRDKP